MAELVFEIGMEEMPARFVRPAMKSFQELAEKELRFKDLEFRETVTHGTPRRLALFVSGLSEMSADKEEVNLGPPVKAGFDKDGNPTKAAFGFAKSQGVDVSELEQVDTDRGPRLAHTKKVIGRPVMDILQESLPKLVGQIPFPKTMRWGSGSFRFARPIHWFLAILDGQVVPFELAGIKSGNQTRGHRFNAPGSLEVKSANEYVKKLRDARVHVLRNERAELTATEIQQASIQTGGRLVINLALLAEVVDLVEQPVACCGSFDKEFLVLPRPVIISAMASHQRYFALENSREELLPNFIAINNTRPKDLSVVSRGHERVLRARLADAKFFLDEDLKKPLIEGLNKLERVTYHAKLGTSREKVERFTKLALYLAGELAPELKTKVEKAALLAKCDLVTEMVGEFPDLQGVIGAEYARRGGEDTEVAQAIEEHYMPTGGDAKLPEGMIGALVGLADRIDTICGLFGVDEKPSGAADPFALRRAAIGVIRIVTEKELKLNLDQALEEALNNLKPWLRVEASQVKEEVKQFFAARFQSLLADLDVPTDVAQAVLAAGMDDLLDVKARALALAAVKESADFKPLAVGLKRVMNILRKEAAQVPDTEPREDLLKEPQEDELYRAFGALTADLHKSVQGGDYQAFLKSVVALKEPVDSFFDNVLVLDKDQDVRRNRLALLRQISEVFDNFAEFTHLQLA